MTKPNLGNTAMKSTPMKAAELRRIVKRLDLFQLECAKLLGVDPRTLRRWMTGESPIPKQTQLLMRQAEKVGRSALDG